MKKKGRNNTNIEVPKIFATGHTARHRTGGGKFDGCEAWLKMEDMCSNEVKSTKVKLEDEFFENNKDCKQLKWTAEKNVKLRTDKMGDEAEPKDKVVTNLPTKPKDKDGLSVDVVAEKSGVKGK